jgi:hypothetical protein
MATIAIRRLSIGRGVSYIPWFHFQSFVGEILPPSYHHITAIEQKAKEIQLCSV